MWKRNRRNFNKHWSAFAVDRKMRFAFSTKKWWAQCWYSILLFLSSPYFHFLNFAQNACSDSFFSFLLYQTLWSSCKTIGFNLINWRTSKCWNIFFQHAIEWFFMFTFGIRRIMLILCLSNKWAKKICSKWIETKQSTTITGVFNQFCEIYVNQCVNNIKILIWFSTEME